ncbi:hypothetical protein ACFE04_002517 [Oxalis oulophora]
MEESVEIDELSLEQMMEDYSLYGDMHAKTNTFLTNVLKKWKGKEFFIHEVNGDRLYKLLDTSTWVDDHVFFPICRQSHWFLMVATVKTRKVQVFDSLEKHSKLQKIMEWVKHILNDSLEIQTKWRFHIVNGLPQQPDLSSCGIFTLINMRRVANGTKVHRNRNIFGEIGETLGLPALSKRGCRDLLQTNYIYVETPSKTLTSGTLCFILLGGSGISGIRALPTTALPLEVPVRSISFVETNYKPASTNTFAGCQ